MTLSELWRRRRDGIKFSVHAQIMHEPQGHFMLSYLSKTIQDLIPCRNTIIPPSTQNDLFWNLWPFKRP